MEVRSAAPTYKTELAKRTKMTLVSPANAAACAAASASGYAGG
jgi:hypothetical protein